MNVIEIKDLNFSYGDNELFKNLNLLIRKNSFLTILGKNGIGKSTLANLINNRYQGVSIKEGDIAYIFSDSEKQIVGKTVQEQLTFYLKEQRLNDNQIKLRLSKIVKEFSLKQLLDKDPYELNISEKQIIILLSNLIADFNIIILDDALSFIDPLNKDKLFKYMLKKKRTIINFTNCTEECIYGSEVAILNKNIILQEKTMDALKEEKLFLENSLKLPFMADLSLKLQYYNLMNDIVIDMDDVVNIIWN